MKRLALVVMMLILPVTALAQSRSRTTRRGAPPAKTTKPATTDSSALKTEAAARVATQIKNLTTFLYLLGGVAKDLDAQALAARSGSSSPTQEKNMAKITSYFEDVRVGLENLETYFSGNSDLRPYYGKLLGSADAAANAKSQAGTGHVDQAGHTLINVVNQLTDVLAILR